MNSGKRAVVRGGLAVVLGLWLAGCGGAGAAMPGPAVVFNPDAALAPAPPIGPHFRLPAADEAALAKLRQTKVGADFDATPFGEVVDNIRKATGVNFVVNWRAMAAVNIKADDPVTLKLDSVRVDRLLELVLSQVGGEEVALGYCADDGVIMIAPREFLDERAVMRLYDVTDLLDARFMLDRYLDMPEFRFDRVMFDVDEEDVTGVSIQTLAQARYELATRLMDLIRNAVDPDCWHATGGLNSSMEYFNRGLVINTHARAHRQVSALLRKLRQQQQVRLNCSVQLIVLPDAVYEQEMRPHLVMRPAAGEAALGGSGVIAAEHAATIARYARQSTIARAIALPVAVVRPDATAQIVLGESEPVDHQPDPVARAALGLREFRTLTHGVGCTLRGMRAAGDGSITIDMDTVIANRHIEGAGHRTGYHIVMPDGATYLADAGNIPPSAVAALAPGLHIANPRLVILIGAKVIEPIDDADDAHH